MIETETKKIITDMIASISNKDPDHIKLEDVRTKKKKKKKGNTSSTDTVVENRKGLELTDSHPQYVGYDDPKGTKKRWVFDPHKNILEWTTWDLFEYAHCLYLTKYNEDWQLMRGGNTNVIKSIFEKLENKFGNNNWLLMKDYITFFFDKHIDDFYRKKGREGSYFDYMAREDIIKSFFTFYDLENNLRKWETLQRNRINSSNLDISNQLIDKAYMLSDITLVSTYGFLIPLHWLVSNKKMKKKDSMSIILSACQKLYEKKLFSIVIKSTQKYSPYPEWMLFKDVDKFLNRIDKNLKINIEFSKNEKNRLDFLKKV